MGIDADLIADEDYDKVIKMIDRCIKGRNVGTEVIARAIASSQRRSSVGAIQSMAAHGEYPSPWLSCTCLT